MKKPLFVFILFLSSWHCFAQHSQTTNVFGNEALFYSGKELFTTGNYIGCIVQLSNYKANTIHPEQIAETDYMLAAASYETHAVDSKKQLENFLIQNPFSRNIDRVKFLLGSLSFFNNHFGASLALLKSVNQQSLFSNDQQDCQYRLAYAYLSVDSLAKSQNIFRELLHNSVKYENAATYYLAWFDYKAEQYDKSTAGFESIKNVPEYSENARFYLTQMLFIKQKYETTIQSGGSYYDKMTNKTHKTELARILGESYYHLDNMPKAIQYLSDYAENESAPLPSSMYQLGTAWYGKGDYTKAIQYLKHATGNVSEMNQNAYFYLGCASLKIVDKKSARLAFESASLSSINLKTKELALYNYAMLIHETAYTGFNESIAVFENFLSTFPDSYYADKVSGYLSEVYMTSKNYTAAIASMRKIKHPSTKILTAKQRILFLMGTQAVVNSKLEEANRYLTDALEIGRMDIECFAETNFWRAEVAFRQAQYKDAASFYQNYIINSSSNNKENLTLANYNIGYTLLIIKEIAKAKNAYEKALAVGYKKNPTLTADILNRLGDCNFYAKNYTNAANYYSRAAQTAEASADYSLFQQAQIMSLQKQYNAQINLIDKILFDYPKSDYRDDALFEKARAYQNLDQKELAVKTYTELMTTYPESSFSRDAGVQMGMVYFGMNDLEKSIEWYKYTIETYAGSDEANVANEDLKRIYKDQNRIGEYAQFLKTLGGKVVFSASEQDSLMYLGAEKIYMKGQKQVAESSFKEYLKEFPAGAFSLNANYYLATLNLDEKKDSVATIYLQNIVNRPDNKFTQQALKSSAEIAYSQSNYDKAYTYYKALAQKAESSKKRTEIRTKMLRCLWFGNKPSDVIEAATIILDDPKAEIAAKIESRYYRAKSNLALQKSDNLVADLTILAADTRNVMGAEAKYLLANYYFDTENSKKAESEILDYIEKGTAHQHWLARSFILLSDIYLKNNDQFQARQYLLSLKNNYKEKDPEIEKMIDERITKFQ